MTEKIMENEMKYICTINSEGKEEIFTFPATINHDAMAESISGIKNHTHGDWERVLRDPVSAGFVDADSKCYGESESLGIESRPEDSALLAAQL
ncbi:MAG: hypothetical protein HOD58_06255 [Gammaproteobacteria bacterium]|jgi:hypothetical protein|nr:hypothetical protein [Candidatus Neomarinimicrobiota bacterium]MBT4329511.1 hypothetical protein [Gammaproteobacteria bacterium]MBT5268071.1 hypothetical protein [Candidatus Neomarinimicrobiota bacterium]MBT7082108.1 hypothetical protein [Chloroflexota bacterium]